MTVLPYRVKTAEYVRMVSTATRVLVRQATLGITVRQVSRIWLLQKWAFLFKIETDDQAIHRNKFTRGGEGDLDHTTHLDFPNGYTQKIKSFGM